MNNHKPVALKTTQIYSLIEGRSLKSRHRQALALSGGLGKDLFHALLLICGDTATY